MKYCVPRSPSPKISNLRRALPRLAMSCSLLGACGDDGSASSSEGVETTGSEGESTGPAADASESSGGETDVPVVSEFDGVWTSRGYGYVLQVSEGQFALFESTQISCVSADEGGLDTLSSAFDLQVTADDELSVLAPDAFGPLLFDRLADLPDACADGGTPVVGEPAYERDALQLFDITWQTFSEQYAFFELKEVDWDEVGNQARAGLSSSSDDDALFEALTELMAPLNDGHVSLSRPGDEYESGRFEIRDIFVAEFEAQDDIEDFDDYAAEQFEAHIAGISSALDGGPQGATDAMLWGRLPDNIGYLGYFGFEPEDEDDAAESLDELDAAVESLADTDALVIDLRVNSGGSDAYALEVASRFFDEEREVFRKAARNGDTLNPIIEVSLAPFEGATYTKPVYVVTTNSTVSAAEVFTMSMAEAPHVVITGQPSNGIFSDILGRTLPNGWSFGLSNEVYSSPSEEVFEGRGVPVDMSIDLPAFPLADRVDGHDSWLETLATTIVAAG